MGTSKRVSELAQTKKADNSDRLLVDNAGEPESMSISVYDFKRSVAKSASESFVFSGDASFALSRWPTVVRSVTVVAPSYVIFDADFVLVKNVVTVGEVLAAGDLVEVRYDY